MSRVTQTTDSEPGVNKSEEGQRSDAVEKARQSAAASQRFTKLLTLTTVIVWISAGGMAVWTTDVCLDVFFRGTFRSLMRYNTLSTELMADYGKQGRLFFSDVPEDLVRQHSRLRRAVSHRRLVMELYLILTIALTFTAALLSVWLVVASRRSTLRHIAASILSIEESLSPQAQTDDA